MSRSRIYFDHNATTAVCSAARDAMMRILDGEFGNPSSVHAEGRRARQAVEAAREQVASLVGGLAEEIVFTSGGTEADNLALSLLYHVGGPGVVTSPLEHPAVLGSAQAPELVPVGPDGSLGLETIPAGRPLSLQLANHELGNLYPIAEIAERKQGALFHSDAVQAAGKVAIDVRALGVDLLSLSAHKIGGPKGVGALWVRRGVDLRPLLRGGHQERERRPGTENVVGIVGFGAAAREARSLPSVERLRDRLEAGALALGARKNGGALRVGNTTNLAWEGVPGDLLVEALDLEGVSASTGAACTSGSVQPSPVLRALGQSREQAKEGVRFSLGAGNTEAEVDRVLALLPSLIQRIRTANTST